MIRPTSGWAHATGARGWSWHVSCVRSPRGRFPARRPSRAPVAAAESGLCACSRADARAGHRGQHAALQRDQLRPVAAGPLPRSRPTGADHRTPDDVAGSVGRLSQLPRLARAGGPALQPLRRLAARQLQPDRRGRARAAQEPHGLRRHLSGARRRPGARSHLRARGGRPRRTARRGAHLAAVATSVRLRPRRPRPLAPAQRGGLRGHWSAPRGVPAVQRRRRVRTDRVVAGRLSGPRPAPRYLRGRQAAPRRHHRSGAQSLGRRGRTPRAAVSTDQHREPGEGRADERRPGGGGAHSAAGPLGRGGVRAAHCGRQRRESPAGARFGPAAGDRDPPRDGCRTCPSRAAAAHRKRAARAGGRRIRCAPRHLGHGTRPSAGACDGASRRRSAHRRTGARVHARPLARSRGAVRTRPGAASLRHRPALVPEGRTGHGRSRAGQAAQRARGRGGGAGARPAHRRRAPPAQLRAAHARAAGIRSCARAHDVDGAATFALRNLDRARSIRARAARARRRAAGRDRRRDHRRAASRRCPRHVGVARGTPDAGSGCARGGDALFDDPRIPGGDAHSAAGGTLLYRSRR